MVNASRESLCKDMQLVVLDKGESAVNLERDREFVWYIVIKGRCDMMVRTQNQGKPYSLRIFEEGETFAVSYMELLTEGNKLIQAGLVASEPQTMVVRVCVLPEHRGDFKSLTKPLLFEELAKYFDMSADEAAERLGVCMSAIKKICRRHGIVRWPHRKLLSANKAIAVIESKMSETNDVAMIEALRFEVINVLVSKLRVVRVPESPHDP